MHSSPSPVSLYTANSLSSTSLSSTTFLAPFLTIPPIPILSLIFFRILPHTFFHYTSFPAFPRQVSLAELHLLYNKDQRLSPLYPTPSFLVSSEKRVWLIIIIIIIFYHQNQVAVEVKIATDSDSFHYSKPTPARTNSRFQNYNKPQQYLLADTRREIADLNHQTGFDIQK